MNRIKSLLAICDYAHDIVCECFRKALFGFLNVIPLRLSVEHSNDNICDQVYLIINLAGMPILLRDDCTQ